MLPKVLVVCLNYRTAEMTLRSVRAALGAMRGLNAELVLVDNASGDGSVEVMQQALDTADWARGAPIRLIASDHNGGFGAGNNIGIQAGWSDGSRPDYVFLLNSDAFPAPDVLRLLVAHMEGAPDCAFTGCYIHGEDGAEHLTTFRFPTLWSELDAGARLGPINRALRNRVVPRAMTASGPVDWLAGAAVMMRDSVLREIGGFDEQFFLYFEETELCLRAARAGYGVHYLREARVMHIGSVSTGMRSWDRIPGFWLDSRYYFFAKSYGRAYAAGALALRVLGESLHRLRSLATKTRRTDPAQFLRDLIVHDLKHLSRPLPEARVPFGGAASAQADKPE